LLLLITPHVRAEQADPLPQILDQFAIRTIGPANMSGRIAALAVDESKPSTFYVASASGGLWKTVNQAASWTPIFDNQPTVSLGDVAVAPSNPEIVWAGTGESNARNSVSWGDGVYKSTDGGKSWRNMGLRDTHHIGRIIIHPKNPDVVYVAALGHLWGPNPERGIFKTSDGGKTWHKVLFLNEDTGCIDLVLNPSEPETLIAAAYQVRRDAFSAGNPAVMTGPEAGLYRTTDGGKNWKRIKEGLPGRPMGRIGLDLWHRDPRIVYAVIQTDLTLLVREFELGQPQRPNPIPDSGGVFRSVDGGVTWQKLNDLCPRPFYFSKIRIDPTDSKRIYVLGVTLHLSVDGGRSFARGMAPGVHFDHHALWINPAKPEQMVLGTDGGVYLSQDRGASWEHARNLPIAQFYGIGLDQRKPYRVYGGLQDNGTWVGVSQTRRQEGITPADWFRILPGDGFQCQVDPSDPDVVFAETQYGGLHRLNLRSEGSLDIKPRSSRGIAYRFNWSAPILLSPHQPQTFYYGGNVLFASTTRGDTWTLASPDLTRGQPGVSSYGHTLTTLAESPLKKGLLYTGSDDGMVHVSRDGGDHWTNVSERIPAVPANRWITRVECSSFAEGTAYLSLDRHRNEDRKPYLFKTDDWGKNWKPITGNLPAEGPIHVVRADPRNPDLLFVGTEFGLFVSLDGGGKWHRFGKGLPTVAVHDLAIQPRDRELVVATHGRGIWIVDITPLEQITPQLLAASVYLFEIKPATVFPVAPGKGLATGKSYRAPNPEYGAAIWYWLKEKVEQPGTLTITDSKGQAVLQAAVKGEPGLHRFQWSLRRGLGQEAPLVGPGEYKVVLALGGLTLTQKVRVEE
jgi:photosystem II stability/assembly factor-like uncharacterized protein